MAGEKHLLLSWGGDYVPNTMPGEIWMNTLRLALVFGSVDPVATLPSNYEPVAATIARTEATYTIAGNWAIQGPLTSTFQPDDYLNDQVEPALATWMLYAQLSNQVRLRWIELAVCGAPSGNQVPAPPYATGSPCRLEYTSSYPVGNLSGTQLPPNNSIVVSHRTQQVGPKGRGRMFLPTTTSGSLSGGKIGTTPQTDIAAAQVALLEALGGEFGDDVNVRPAVIGKPYTSYAVINQVQVGNVMDSQRRRRNAFTETYVSDSVSY
ncbi:MAG TPA: hypothetical protein PLY35_12960 [Thermotogota bacterium]|nr:hypothetical protein [Thermotogota bacterium]